MLRIAVCDDEQDCLNAVVEQIHRWSRDRGMPVEVYPCENGDRLLTLCAGTRMDIVLLDVIMPLLSGLNTARELRQQDTAVQIIFLTSSREYAVESYEVNARNYLLKPLSPEKLDRALELCVKTLDAERESLVVKTPGGYRKLFYSDVEYIEAQNKHVMIHLRSGESVTAVQPLHTIEMQLTGDSFYKCHRSYLVYLPNVGNFTAAGIVTHSGENVPIARGQLKRFREAYFSVMFRET